MNKTEEKVRNHPLVVDISDERKEKRRFKGCGENADGIWVYLKEGYINWLHEVHCVHEDTWTECLAQLKNVRPCGPNCECKR